MSVRVCKPFSYSDPSTPQGYSCGTCKASGVRLYREYNILLDYQSFACRACAFGEREASKPSCPYTDYSGSEHSIGWRVAAVPTEDGSSFWGFTSVPEAGVLWWERLPKTLEPSAV